MTVEFSAAPGWLAPERRVYAIGDIHGCLEQLLALHELIRADLAARPVGAPVLLHIGDYVDRGPDSRGVVALLVAGDPIAGVPTVNLMGNHERTMLDALGGAGASMTDWMISGGKEALASWGGSHEAPRETWPGFVPPEHTAWLAALAHQHRLDGYLFAHAGVRPGVALDDQVPQDLMTIRNSCLDSEANHGAVVGHGHTPRGAPEVRHNRIGIDTGAVFGGELTCVVLEGDRLGFLTV